MPDAFLKPTDNATLDSLSSEEWRRLSPYAERMSFLKGQVLHDCGDVPRFAFFPGSGMFSMLATTEGGLSIQVATVSNREFAGLCVMSRTPVTSQVVVTIRGEGYRIRAEPLRQEFQRCATFQAQVLRLVDRFLVETAQSLLCHRYHTVRQRLSRWLLNARECAGGEVIELTQERISELLAIPRSAISGAAAAFQERGLIRQRHGRIQILRRNALEALTCECYHVLRPSLPPTRSHVAPRSPSPPAPPSHRDGAGSFGT